MNEPAVPDDLAAWLDEHGHGSITTWALHETDFRYDADTGDWFDADGAPVDLVERLTAEIDTQRWLDSR